MDRQRYTASMALIAAFAGLVFGYDTAVISGAIGYLTTYFKLSPTAEGWAVSSALVGCVIGALVVGEVGNRLGRKRTLLLAALSYGISGAGTALAHDFTVFWIFRIFGGIAIGLTAMAPLYITEISPKESRGRLTSMYQLAITLGVVVVYIANWAISHAGGATTDWAVTQGWRWMLGSVTLPSALLLMMLTALPESPRWLLLRGRDLEARTILNRLAAPAQAEEVLREHAHDVRVREAGRTVSVFSGPVLPILVIACVLGILQQAVGINVIIYYGTKLMTQLKLGGGVEGAFFQQVLVGVTLFLSTLIGIALVDRWGRRPLLLMGSLGVTATILTVGTALFFHAEGPWLLGVILLYIVFFAATLGPIVWVMIAELAPDAARARVVSIASMCLWLANIGVSQTFPMINEGAVNKAQFNGALPFFVYGACGLAFFLFTLARVPETKGRSLGQMGRLAA